MRAPRSKAWAGIASGAVVFATTFAAAIDPPPVLSVSEWAERYRMVSAESASPYPGKWRNALVPYAVEPMDCLSFSDPCRDVVFKKSHQIGGTEIGVNLFGYTVDQQPSPVVIVLPTIDEGLKYDRVKLTPTIEATPALRGRIKAQRSRDESGSTRTFKRYPGGPAIITGANSSTGLQMISARVLIAEEISEWPADAGNRGDPLVQVEKRLTAWSMRGQKRYYSATPALAGTCRISIKYDASDQRRYYVPCPHCETFQTLRFENLKRRSDHAPFGAHFICAANGCVIEHYEKQAMITAGVWVKTFDDGDATPGQTIEPDNLAAYRARDSKGRQPGFAIWQAYSPFTDWNSIVADYLEAKDVPEKEKPFCQQILGEPYEESGEAPDYDKLVLCREAFPLGIIPPGGLVLTGMADVQINRIEWAVYAWGIGMTGWLVDKGIVEGDPAKIETWGPMGEVVGRTYEDRNGTHWPVEAFGVDAGFLSNMVYLFCRGRERVFALDGRGGPLHPAIGTPRKKDVSWRGKVLKRGVMLWPTGTWSLKSWVYAALRKSIEGPDEAGVWPMGCLRYPDACDVDFFKQLTAEYLLEVEVKGTLRREWRKIKNQPNEQLDIAVGARALASHLRLDSLSRDAWEKIAVDRGAPPEEVERDLAVLSGPEPAPTNGKPEVESPNPAHVARSKWMS